MNFVEDNRKWRLPSREEIVEFVEHYPDKVVDVAYRNGDNGRDFEDRRCWYFTEEFFRGNYHENSNVVVYDVDNKVFKDFYSINWRSGFGGLPWANCTWYSNLLWKNITQMFNHKNITISDNETSELVMVINRTVNLAHNNVKVVM